jgi:hypothetical protein
MDAADRVLLDLIAEEVLRPETIRLALDEAVAQLTAAPTLWDRRGELEQALVAVEEETVRQTSGSSRRQK